MGLGPLQVERLSDCKNQTSRSLGKGECLTNLFPCESRLRTQQLLLRPLKVDVSLPKPQKAPPVSFPVLEA